GPREASNQRRRDGHEPLAVPLPSRSRCRTTRRDREWSRVMKVRIGYGLGTRSITNDNARFTAFVDALEGSGFDSLCLSEGLAGDGPDPVIAAAVAAGRTKKLKLGTSVQVLPGRNPIVLAKEWATLDRLSGGRALPAFGLGVADPREQQAFGVER